MSINFGSIVSTSPFIPKKPLSTPYDDCNVLPDWCNLLAVTDVIDAIALYIIEPNMDQGPWVAGGAALRWYQNLPLDKFADIDVWFKNKEQYNKLYEKFIDTNNISLSIETDNAATFTMYHSKGERKIQLIKSRWSDNVHDVINNFDISVSKVATDGFKFVLADNTAADIRSKTLRMDFPLQPMAIKRASKYMCYGYRPVPGLMDALVNNPNQTFDFNSIEDY